MGLSDVPGIHNSGNKSQKKNRCDSEENEKLYDFATAPLWLHHLVWGRGAGGLYPGAALAFEASRAYFLSIVSLWSDGNRNL